MGAYFAPAAPLWDDPQLLRNAAAAAALAETLGPASAIVMRGNGLVTAAASLQHAVVLSWYFEDAARLELDILSTNLPAAELTLQDAHRRATFEGGILERMWSYLTAGDPEG
jgi:HCOMODA/2-hydroxy-3-carboxy-muconic semialdehyde decarboxylase